VKHLRLSEQSNTTHPSEARRLTPTHHPIAQTTDPQPHPLPCSPTNGQLPHQSNTVFIHFSLNQEICQEINDLMAKAWHFSCRAKCFSGRKRDQIYRQKALTLSQAIELFPQGFRVLSHDLGTRLIGLLPPTGPRLHCHLDDMTVSAKQLLAHQLLQKHFNV
jgi:hypothetical protein